MDADVVIMTSAMISVGDPAVRRACEACDSIFAESLDGA